MDSVLTEVLAANERYAAQFGDNARLTPIPARKIAILTCMDARLDPAKYAGLKEGDAHVIRNAGGRASNDAIRSLVMSYKLLGTCEWFVVHHTECGLVTLTDDDMADLLSRSLEPAVKDEHGWHDVGKGPGSYEGGFIHWMTIKDPVQSLVDDVRRIRCHPLVPGSIPIYGYFFDVKTGRLVECPEAMAAGKTS